jgi:hypothetical protein
MGGFRHVYRVATSGSFCLRHPATPLDSTTPGIGTKGRQTINNNISSAAKTDYKLTLFDDQRYRVDGALESASCQVKKHLLKNHNKTVITTLYRSFVYNFKTDGSCCFQKYYTYARNMMQLAVVAEDLKKCQKWAENADNGLLQFQAWINNICKT